MTSIKSYQSSDVGSAERNKEIDDFSVSDDGKKANKKRRLTTIDEQVQQSASPNREVEDLSINVDSDQLQVVIDKVWTKYGSSELDHNQLGKVLLELFDQDESLNQWSE